MNVPTSDDVFAGVKARLTAEPGWAAAVPGDLWQDRRAAGKDFPYAVMTCEERPPAYVQSDGTYVQDYAVEVSVWCTSADAAAAPSKALRNMLDNALGWINSDPANGLTVPNAVATLQVRPAGGSLRLNAELRRGQDVMVAGKRIEVRVQGKR